MLNSNEKMFVSGGIMSIATIDGEEYETEASSTAGEPGVRTAEARSIGILANDILIVGDSDTNYFTQLMANGGDDNPYSQMDIWSGGTAEFTGVSSGGTMNVSSGALAENATIYANGIMNVQSGGTANGIVFDGGGVLNLSGLGSGILMSSATLNMFSGALISNGITIRNGGVLNLNGGILSGAFTSGGGLIEITGGRDVSSWLLGGTQNVRAGGSAIGIQIESNGIQNLYDGGYTSVTKVVSGIMNVYGGYAENPGVFLHGVLMQYGGSVNNAEVSGTLNVSGGTAAHGGIIAGGVLNVYSGGYASSFAVAGTQNVYSGAIASDGFTLNTGIQTVYNGGVTRGFEVFSAGKQAVSSGGIASNTIVTRGGVQAVSSGGTIDGAVVSGLATLASAAVARGNVHVAGSMTIAAGADTASMTLYLNVSNLQSGIPLVDDVSHTANGVYAVEGVASLADGDYLIAGNTGTVIQYNIQYSGTTEVGSSFLWDADSKRYTGVIVNGERYSLKSDAGGLYLSLSQRYVVKSNTTAYYVGNDVSYTDMREGVAANSILGALVAGETYNAAIVMGGKGQSYSGTVTTLINGGGVVVGKIVYGGTMNGTIGSTHMIINDGSDLNDDIFCGNMASTGTTAIQSGISIDVRGGAFAKSIYGGSRVSGGTHTVNGGITGTFTGGTFNKNMWIMGGGYVTGASSVLTVNGGVHMTVSNLAITAGSVVNGRGLYLGAWVTANGKAYVKDGVTATVNSGTLTYMYGGGWSQGGANSLSVVDANGAAYAVDITVNGGSIDYLFGGGSHAYLGAIGTEGGASTVIGDIRLTINGGTFTQISISGEYEADTVTGNGELIFTGQSATSVGSVYGYRFNNMSGTATLTFDGYSGAFSAAVYNFNAVKFSGDAAVALNGQDLSKVSDWHFDGEGRTSTGTMAEWDTGTNDFTGDIFHIWLTSSYETELTLLTSTDSGIFQNYADLKFQIYVDGTQVGGTFDFDSKYNGWGLNFSNNTLKYTNLA